MTARQRIFSPVVFASLQRLLRSRAYRLAILPYMAPSLPAATSGAGLVGEAATSWVGLALSFLLGASVAALTAAAMVHRRRAARRGRGGRRVTASGEAARRFLAAIVESSEDAIIGKTLEGTITSWNRGAERMFGYTAEEVIGRPISIIVPPEVDNDLPTILERLRRGERVEHYQTVRMRKDGTRLTISLSISPIHDRDGRIIAASKIARDITEEVERQRELEQANFYLEELNAELELQKEEAQHLAAELGEANRRLERAKAAAEREARRITGLQAMTAALAAALTECDVAASAVDHGVVALDARAAAFLRLTADAQALECGPAFGWSPEALECLERLPLTEPSLPTLAIEQSDPVFLEDPMPGGPLSPSVERLHRCLSAAGVVVAVPIQAKGRPLGVLALAFDRRRNLSGEDRRVLAVIGSLVGQALERARLYEAGMEAKRVAEEASQARSQFLAVMSHELRTPLNAILGYQDLLTAEVVGPLNETQKRHAERIGSSARHLLQLIDDILSLSRLEAGKEEVRPERVDAIRLAREVAEMIQPMAERKGLAFRVSTSGDSFPLESDPGRLRQILLNLLGNAVKFTDRGEIELSVARDSDDMVVFTVRDTGVGIAPADQERIFEPFIQATAAAPGVAGGTGLGLAVSRNLARLLGGDLIVESELGQGSTFVLRIPVQAGVPLQPA